MSKQSKLHQVTSRLFRRSARNSGYKLTRIRFGVRPYLEVLEDRLTPSNIIITVNDNRDVLDNPANVTVSQLGSQVSLRDAINAANNTAGTDSYVINLPANTTFDLTTIDNYWYGPNGLPAITSNITIQGNGSVIQRDQATSTPDFRQFYVSGGFDTLPAGSLTLEKLTLQGGEAKSGDSDLGGGGLGAGGAIFNQGAVSLTGVTIQNSSAVGGSSTGNSSGSPRTGGGGIGQDGLSNGDGGGMGGDLGGGGLAGANGGNGGAGGNGGGGGAGFNGGAGGFGGGGGFGMGSGDLMSGAGGQGGFGGGGGGRSNEEFGGGHASGGFGGGIGNPSEGAQGGGGAGMGGAIFNMGGSLTITNSTLAENNAQGGSGLGGGSSLGGAIFNLDGSVSIVFSTLARNTLTPGIGGPSQEGGSVGARDGGAVYNLTYNLPGISQSATATINDSILSNSQWLYSGGPYQASDLYNNGGTVIYSGPNDIMSRFGTGQSGTTPLTGDPQLATATANNGGPTPTLALASDLTGTPVSGITTDQRGAQRSATSPNLGAFEIQTTTTTVSSNPTVSFNSGKQIVTVTASVSSAVTVNSGTVTFSIAGAGLNVQGNVVNGQASAIFTINAGTAVGQYTITGQYGGIGFAGSATSGSSNGILTISSATNPASTTTTSSNETTQFSQSDQKVTLTANVTSGSGTVNEGTVTFELVQGSTIIGSPVTSGTVNNGQASVSYVVPANTALGTYTIEAAYNAGPDFIDSSDISHTLTINKASTTTTADNGATGYVTGDQKIDLTATVTSAAGPLNQGTVTFTVLQGSTVIGSATTSDTVSNGKADAVYALPTGLQAGTYTIDAVYSGGTDNLTSSDKTHTLTIVSLASTTTASNALANPSSSDQNVSLTATVNSRIGAVNEGTVTFTILQGKTVIGSAVSSAPSDGQVKANYVLPGGTPAGVYTIDAAYSDSLGNFNPSSDTTHTITVGNLVITTTAASSTTTTFSAGNQNVTLTAHVTSSRSVNEGTVTFTLLQGSTVIGSPVTSGAVNNGQASVNYVVPGNVAVGNYTIDAVYSGSSSFNTSSDASHTLKINQASAAVTAANVSTPFSTSVQNVTLTANVSSSSGAVNEGTVTFTVFAAGGVPVGSSVQSNTVSNGLASVSYSLPANTAVGTYTIRAEYNPGSDLTGSTDQTHTLSVGETATGTTAANASTNFSATNQNVTLTATVSSSAGQVNRGRVTFTVLNGTTVIGTAVAVSVSGGQAKATYVLPGGTPGGNYTIDANYSDSSGEFASSSDNNHTLTVGSLFATTTTPGQTVVSASGSNQKLTLTAQVSSSAGPVNEGIVTFTVLQGSTIIGSTVSSGTVSNGQASAEFVLPAGVEPGSYTISAHYGDGTNQFDVSSGTASLVVQAASPSGGSNSSSPSGGTPASTPASAGVVGLAIEEFELTLDSIVAMIEGALGLPTDSLDATIAQLSAAISNDPLFSTPEGQLAIALGQNLALSALHGI